jgi:hypothetical protein
VQKRKGGGGSRTHEITVLQTVALGHLATPPNSYKTGDSINYQSPNLKRIFVNANLVYLFPVNFARRLVIEVAVFEAENQYFEKVL